MSHNKTPSARFKLVSECQHIYNGHIFFCSTFNIYMFDIALQWKAITGLTALHAYTYNITYNETGKTYNDVTYTMRAQKLRIQKYSRSCKVRI